MISRESITPPLGVLGGRKLGYHFQVRLIVSGWVVKPAEKKVQEAISARRGAFANGSQDLKDPVISSHLT